MKPSDPNKRNYIVVQKAALYDDVHILFIKTTLESDL